MQYGAVSPAEPSEMAPGCAIVAGKKQAFKRKRQMKPDLALHSPRATCCGLLLLLFLLVAVASFVPNEDAAALLYIGQRSNGGGMYLSYSMDAKRFVTLTPKDGKPLLRAPALFREPALCLRSGLFHLLWMGPAANASGFFRATSSDLRQWSDEAWVRRTRTPPSASECFCASECFRVLPSASECF